MIEFEVYIYDADRRIGQTWTAIRTKKGHNCWRNWKTSATKSATRDECLARIQALLHVYHAWHCDFCGSEYEFKTEAEAMRHVIECDGNPAANKCQTCRHHDVYEDEYRKIKRMCKGKPCDGNGCACWELKK